MVKPDLIVDNGVCHAIDKALMPEMEEISEPM
jgi:hypothetical protein